VEVKIQPKDPARIMYVQKCKIKFLQYGDYCATDAHDKCYHDCRRGTLIYNKFVNVTIRLS
jgi:hypothetical protein